MGKVSSYTQQIKRHYPELQVRTATFNQRGQYNDVLIVNNALVFSHRGTLELLPALPSAWPKGAVSGILARGQITIDRLQWNRPAGTLRLELTSGRDQTVRLRLATGQAIKSIRVTGADVKDPPGEGGARRVVLSRGRRAVVEMTY